MGKKSLGRMTQARARRQAEDPTRGELWDRDFVITIVYDCSGRPVRAEKRCTNKRCCTPERGTIAVHVWDLETLEYETKVLPDPTLSRGRHEPVMI